MPLGTGITLDKPLAAAHAINAVVRDASVTEAGYQGTPAPDQWFGGPALAPNAGSMVLRDAAGLVADSLNYGGVVDPWAAEGYQGESPGDGCSAPSPGAGRGFGRRGPSASANSRSAGRFPDGADTDSNCGDFHLQTVAALASPSPAGANNIKVSSADFRVGQRIILDSGDNRETALIASVGTPGGTTISTAAEAGATTIHVSNAFGFNPGQTVTIDSGANQETAQVASVDFGRGRFGGRGGPGPSITVSAPLKFAHPEGAPFAGSGITFTAALKKAHESGAALAGAVPTPGAPNQYSSSTR